MLPNIIDGISNRLSEAFGQSYYIYGDKDVVQGLSPPCFFIAVLEAIETYYVGKRRYRKYPFDIHYYPSEDGNNAECYEVAEQLLEELEYITLANKDILRGRNKNYEIIDGVLHFRINYNVFITKESNLDNMENIHINSSIKE